MKSIFIFLLVLTTTLLHAQKFSYPSIKTSAKNIRDFIPSKWFLKDSTIGDLNGDKLADIAAVFEYKDTIQELRPDSSENTGSPRILVIFLKNKKTGTYELFLQNNTFITRVGEGGMRSDAYGEITINKGVLEILFQFTRGHASYKFRMQKNDLYLIGATNNGVSGGKFYGFNANFLTKKAKVEEGYIDEDKLKVKWINFSLRNLKRLRDLKMMMTWEVIPNQYI